MLGYPKDLKKRYSDYLASRYDRDMPSFVRGWKYKTYAESNLKKGDHVIVFCCGTGEDFPMIQSLIGDQGSIHGVDFSAGMLALAKQKIEQFGWHNITLEERDVTKPFSTGFVFDASVCTLGMSTIPDALSAYENMKAVTRIGGKVIVGDYQYLSGWRSVFNPICIACCSKFGGSYATHKESRQVFEKMEQDLMNTRQAKFLFHLYRYCIGEIV